MRMDSIREGGDAKMVAPALSGVERGGEPSTHNKQYVQVGESRAQF